MAKVTLQNGNREITVTTGEVSRWEKDEMARDYIEISSSDRKRQPIAKLYEVIKGSTKDHTVEVNGRTFGYQYGSCCDSKTKRRSVDEAIEEIAAAL
jgi:hypothetical protein